MKRHAAREKAFQLLFQLDMNEEQPKRALEDFLETKQYDPFLKTLVEGVLTHREIIEEKITDHLENWSFSRIATAEKTILRMAVFEMVYMDDIPTAVSINEAIELANKYGDEKSGKFINGILSKMN